MGTPTTYRPSAVIAVAASAGGVEALQQFVAGLPQTLDASVLVVLHIPPTAPSVLPGILARAGKLPARHATDLEPLEPGTILVAPPDRHLTVEDARVRTLPGPRQNGHRPSADTLMRSVAEQYGGRSAGVVLSGMMDDGAAGSRAIQSAGGFVMVQDPSEAAFPWMPLAAIEAADPDVVCTLTEMGGHLERWLEHLDDDRHRREAEMEADDPEDIMATTLSPFTCPECGGTLSTIDEYGTERYRCRVGHSFSEGTLLRGKQDALEAAVWAAIVALEEKSDLCKRIVRRLAIGGRINRMERYEREVADAEVHIHFLKQKLQEMIATFPAVYGDDDGDD